MIKKSKVVVRKTPSANAGLDKPALKVHKA